MSLDRRQFTGLVAGMLAGSALRPDGRAQASTPEPAVDPCNLPPQIQALKPMREGIVPISADERARRVERARQLMAQTGIQAVLMEPGTNLSYFTGVRWGQSERPFVAVIPARGELAWVSPGFEEARAREVSQLGADVRVWQEDESPYARRRRHPARPRRRPPARVGVEERLRFFIVGRRAPGGAGARPTCNADAGDRRLPHDQVARRDRADAARERHHDGRLRRRVRDHARGHDAGRALREHDATRCSRLGGSERRALRALRRSPRRFRTAASQPQTAAGGRRRPASTPAAACDGYQSDITRTTVFGKPTPRQTDVWNLEKRAQDAAFAAAQVGRDRASQSTPRRAR